jgi:integrase
MAWIKWKQEKPPHIEVDIPLLPMLRDELALHSFSEGSTFLAPQGKDQARSKKAFCSLFARWADEAGVKPRLHGFRKGLASILPEMGLSNYHIDVLLGHELCSVASNVYTRGARRREIARELNEQWEKISWE